MHISSVPATVPISSRLSPVQAWQQLLTYLLEHHSGLALNDTPFHDDTAIEEHIDAGITLADAVNFLVEKYELVRIDRKGFTWREPLLHYRNGYSACQKSIGLLPRSLIFLSTCCLCVAISATVAEIVTASHLTFKKNQINIDNISHFTMSKDRSLMSP